MSRRRRLLRTFVPLAIACAIPVSIIWIMGPLIRDSAELQREVQMTNPQLDAPPRGYGTAEPVKIGLETSLKTLHSYDFPNQRDTSGDHAAWGDAVSENVAWVDKKRYDALRIALGDATASFTSEPEEWAWLVEALQADRTAALHCKTPAFATVAPLTRVLEALDWDGLVTGEYPADQAKLLSEACTENDTKWSAGFSSFFGPNNEFMAGLAREQTSNGGLSLDGRGVTGEAPGATRNLLFLLTLQFRPDAVFAHLSADEYDYAWAMNTITPDVRNWYTYLRGKAGRRPVANVVFDTPYLAVDSALMHYQRHYIATLISALGLAGYDIEFSKGSPNANADLHVLLTEDGALSEGARALVNGEGPVLWLPVQGIVNDGNIGPDAAAFGLTAGAVTETPAPSPERVDINGQSVHWYTENRQDRFPSFYPSILGVTQDDSTRSAPVGVAVLQEGNRALINGVALHPEAAIAVTHAITAIAGRPNTVLDPFNGYGVTGTRSAFFAMGATNVNVNLHHDDGTPFENGTRIRVARFSRYGNLKEQTEVTYEAPFSEVLRTHELIVVEAVPTNVVQASSP